MYEQDFETDATGWTPAGDVVLTTSPDSSSSYGTFTGAPYTDFGGYTNAWPGEWGATIDIYIDPAWADGKGFNYSVATNDSAGANLRDFALLVAKDASTGKLLAAAQMGSPNVVLDNLETYENVEITTAGWYTISHSFKDVDGVLTVTVELTPNGGGAAIYSQTLTGGDAIAGVGGNRYGWFTVIDVDGGLAVDNIAKLGVDTGAGRGGPFTGARQTHRRRRGHK